MPESYLRNHSNMSSRLSQIHLEVVLPLLCHVDLFYPRLRFLAFKIGYNIIDRCIWTVP